MHRQRSILTWLGTALLCPALLISPTVAAVALAQGAKNSSAVQNQLEACLKAVRFQQYVLALERCRAARHSARTAENSHSEAKALLSLGLTYWSLSRYEPAIETFKQALPLYRDVGDLQETAKVLNNIGLVYRDLSDYGQAIAFYKQALPLFQDLKDRRSEASVLGNLASAYWSLSDFEQVISLYQQARSVFQTLEDRNSEAKTLWGLGIAHWSLAQHKQAVTFYSQALSLFRQENNRFGEASMLQGLGIVYGELSQPKKEIDFYQQALPLFRDLKNRRQEGSVLNNLGTAYRSLAQYDQAIAYFEQALPIFRAVKGREDEAKTLSNLGTTYRALSQTDQAIDYFEQALFIFREIQDRTGEGWVLSHLGQVYTDQKRPELAIVFYKQSVNVRESIRKGLRSLDVSLQESYAESIAGTYRQLADLLLEQGRILEAQQVLELLKVQEIRAFNQDNRAGAAVPGVAFSPAEQTILKQFDSLIGFGQTLERCRQRNCEQLSQLSEQRRQLAKQYYQTVDQFQRELRARSSDDQAFFDPQLLGDAQELVERTQAKTQSKTVLIYPLVLNKKLWLLWVAAGGVVKSQPVEVSQAQLSEAVLDFRRQMSTCERQPCTEADTQQLKVSSQKLYNWLIRPLETELTQNKVQNLVFALDRTVRYVPMAALYDGQQYLVEKYTLSTILSAALTDTRDRIPFTPQETQVLAMGLSDAVAGFNPLQHVPAELNRIVRQSAPKTQGIYPGQALLNQQFNSATLMGQLEQRQHRIVHIATHGQFVPGNHLASFLLLGNGKKLSIEEIRTLPLMSQVELVVLSACESALGGADQLDGVEIASMSYYFLTRNVKTVLASLWQVNDASTSLLMQTFYQHLSQDSESSPVTKAEALRKAQLSFIRKTVTVQDVVARGSIAIATPEGKSPTPSIQDFSHPYYWAPFILIGSGL